MTDLAERLLKRAVEVARQGMESDRGGPFGAVVARGDSILGEGCNRVTSSNDPTAHAEVVAIRQACQRLGSFSLAGCQIYASCEPCPMCLAAIYWARIDRIVYANSRAQAAAIGFDDEFLYEEVKRPLDARSLPITCLELEEARRLFDDWRNKSDKIPY